MEKVCVLRRRRLSIEKACSTVRLPRRLHKSISFHRRVPFMQDALKKKLENKISHVFYTVVLNEFQFDPTQLLFNIIIGQYPLKFAAFYETIY